jgi:hypothetical protein
MGTAAKPTRENRTITVDFRDEATYFRQIPPDFVVKFQPIDIVDVIL